METQPAYRNPGRRETERPGACSLADVGLEKLELELQYFDFGFQTQNTVSYVKLVVGLTNRLFTIGHFTIFFFVHTFSWIVSYLATHLDLKILFVECRSVVIFHVGYAV